MPGSKGSFEAGANSWLCRCLILIFLSLPICPFSDVVALVRRKILCCRPWSLFRRLLAWVSQAAFESGLCLSPLVSVCLSLSPTSDAVARIPLEDSMISSLVSLPQFAHLDLSGCRREGSALDSASSGNTFSVLAISFMLLWSAVGKCMSSPCG